MGTQTFLKYISANVEGVEYKVSPRTRCIDCVETDLKTLKSQSLEELRVCPEPLEEA